MKNNKKWFYGIYGIEFIWRGCWSDPELIWHGKSFSYNDLETALYYDFIDEYPNGNENDFAVWVKKNAHIAIEYLQNLLDNKYFYGGCNR